MTAPPIIGSRIAIHKYISLTIPSTVLRVSKTEIFPASRFARAPFLTAGKKYSVLFVSTTCYRIEKPRAINVVSGPEYMPMTTFVMVKKQTESLNLRSFLKLVKAGLSGAFGMKMIMTVRKK